MERILSLEKKLLDKNADFLKSFINTRDELSKVFQERGEKEIVKNHLLSKGIIIRMYNFYCAQKQFNEKFGREKKISASDFFQDTVACYLGAYLAAFPHGDFKVWVEKRYPGPGKKYRYPDIAIEAGGEVKFILEAKTQLGWKRPLDNAGNVRKEDNGLIIYADRIKNLLRYFRIPHRNFYLVFATRSNWMRKGLSLEDILDKHRRAGYEVPKRKQFVILSKEFPSPDEKKFSMTQGNQLADGDFQDFIEPLFQKIKG